MNEEALLSRAAEERENLFNRYARGRENPADIDPWEDPGNEVYQCDRYGFIQGQNLSKKNDSKEIRNNEHEMQRIKKWLKMLKAWNNTSTIEKLERRIFKGIPNSLRPQVWCKLLDLSRVKGENKRKYEEMLRLARLWSTDARQIDSDVNRQFRDHVNYRERYSLKQQSLFNVLCAYAMYNSEVGYCQGMSGLAGVLLMYMDEEEAFWALCVLFKDPKYAMHGLYIEGFPKLTRFLEHHDKVITKFMPKLKHHFDRFGLDAILYSLKWFFVCFVDRVPFSLCLRVWDLYLVYGERVITAMAFTVLRMHKKAILKLNDMDSIVQYIQVKLFKDFGFDDDTVINNLENNMKELRKAKLDHPGPPPQEELPQRVFGQFVEPDVRRKIGTRAEHFSEAEKKVRASVLLRREKNATEMDELLPSQTEIAGIRSRDEETGSVLGSRRSLADTSVTSTADLSAFSSTRSHAPDNSLDTHSNVSDDDDDDEDDSGSVRTRAFLTPNDGRIRNETGNGQCPALLDQEPNHNFEILRQIQKSDVIVARTNMTVPRADVVRIHVPYCDPPTPQPGPPTSLALAPNTIRIQVGPEDLPTPLVHHGRIQHFLDLT